MTLYAGDRGPKAIRIDLRTAPVDGTLVDAVVVRVRRPDGTETTWTPTIASATTTLVSLTYVLDGAGADLSIPGQYAIRAWAYDDGSALLLDSDESSFRVRVAQHSWPTAPT